MAIERVPKVKHPRLFDRVIVEAQQGLADTLEWLDHSFGRAEKVIERRNGARVVLPAVYAGRNEYLNINPDDRMFGNYSFFTIEDPQNVEFAGKVGKAKANFSLVVWLDLRSVEDEYERNVEAVKASILKALSGGILIRSGALRIHRVFEHPDAVFSGFSYDHIEASALMHPFCGLRFSGEIVTNDLCE